MTGGRASAAAAGTWPQVWAARRAEPGPGTIQEQLLAADGFGDGLGKITAAAWTGYVQEWAEKLKITSGTSVFEVGCGAGAWLYPLYQIGCQVSGADLAPRLIGRAGAVMPGSDFTVAGALDFPAAPPVDVAASMAVFPYFPDHGYAAAVIQRMAARARGSVVVMDVPDLAHRADDLGQRIRHAGGASDFAARYRGLPYLYYDRDWFADMLRAAGLCDITITGQDIDGYRDGIYRFSACGRAAGVAYP